jgi:hypothetical protein
VVSRCISTTVTASVYGPPAKAGPSPAPPGWRSRYRPGNPAHRRVTRLLLLPLLVLAGSALTPTGPAIAALEAAQEPPAGVHDAPREPGRRGLRPAARAKAAGAEPSLTIGDGSGLTGVREVTVRAHVQDPEALAREYELVEAGAFAGTWTPWPEGDTLEVPFALSAGDGKKRLDIRYRSSSGTIELSATVRLDATAPVVKVVANGGDKVTINRLVRLRITASDASELRGMWISTDDGQSFGPKQPFDGRVTVDLPPGTRAGPVRIVVRVKDAAGNIGQGRDSIRFQPRPHATMALRIEYQLKVDLSYARGTLAVEQMATIQNRVDRFVTHVDLYLMPRAFGELRSGPRVSVDGVRVDTGWTNNANLRVRLPAPLAKGERAKVRIRFGLRASGSIRSSLETRLAKANGIMTVGHWFATVGAGYPMRYPGDALVSPVADRIVVDLRHDRGLVVAAPGRLTDSSATRKRYVLAPARDFAFAVSPTFRRVSGMAGGSRVEVYARSTGAASAALSTARSAVGRFGAVLGRYPWSRLVIAESPWLDHGTEYSGYVMVGARMLPNRLLIAHEVAHEWFQALVGNDQFREPWLDESVAEFLSRLYFGRPAGYCSSRPIDSSIFEYPNVQMPVLAAQCGSYYQTVYLKGQAMYYGLRSRMGEAALLGALRAVVTEHSWDLLSSAELRAMLLRYGAPRSYVDGFLRGW